MIKKEVIVNRVPHTSSMSPRSYNVGTTFESMVPLDQMQRLATEQDEPLSTGQSPKEN